MSLAAGEDGGFWVLTLTASMSEHARRPVLQLILSLSGRWYWVESGTVVLTRLSITAFEYTSSLSSPLSCSCAEISRNRQVVQIQSTLASTATRVGEFIWSLSSHYGKAEPHV